MKKIIITFLLIGSVTAYGQLEPQRKIMNPSSSEDFAGYFSDGSEWTHESMTFELGTFVGSAPTLGEVSSGGSFAWVPVNASDPAIKWETEGYAETGWVADYHGPGQDAYIGFFDGITYLPSNDSPFVPGAQLYIWGFGSSSASSQEWILFMNPSWTVPLLSTMPDPSMVTYGLTDSGTTTVGGFGSMTHGPGQQLVSTAIPEPSTYALILGVGVLGFLGFRRYRK